MLGFLLFLSSVAAQGTASQSEQLRGLESIPNTTVRYYDVSGGNVTEINRSMARQRPTGPRGKPVPASTNWSISSDFERTVTDGQCRVTAAHVNFKADAQLPRLLDDRALEAPVRKRWQNYVNLLEDGSLLTLAFVHHNLKSVEKAILSSSCETAKDNAAKAIERLRIHTAHLASEREKQLEQQNRSLAEFRPGMLTDRERICKELQSTESRVRAFQVCMPKREWERLATETEEALKKRVNTFSTHNRGGMY